MISSNTTCAKVIRGTESTYLSGALDIIHGFLMGFCCQSLFFCVCFFSSFIFAMTFSVCLPHVFHLGIFLFLSSASLLYATLRQMYLSVSFAQIELSSEYSGNLVKGVINSSKKDDYICVRVSTDDFFHFFLRM